MKYLNVQPLAALNISFDYWVGSPTEYTFACKNQGIYIHHQTLLFLEGLCK